GGGLATQALARGHSVIGFDRSGVAPALEKSGAEVAGSLPELVDRLAPPRLVLLYVPHGPTTEEVVTAVGELLTPDDILADGGNSHWRDSVRRSRAVQGRGIRYLDI